MFHYSDSFLFRHSGDEFRNDRVIFKIYFIFFYIVFDIYVQLHYIIKYFFFFFRKLKPYLPMSVAWFGTNQLQEENVHRMGVYMVVTHSRYQAVDKGFINDIALVKLQGKMNFSQFVHPVSLPCVDHVFTSSSECWLTGWGNIGNNGELYI